MSKLDELIARRDQTIARLEQERIELGYLGAEFAQPVRATQQMTYKIGKVTRVATTVAGFAAPVVTFLGRANPTWRIASLGVAAMTGMSQRHAAQERQHTAEQGDHPVKPNMKKALMAGAALAAVAGGRMLWSRLASRKGEAPQKEAVNRWESEGGNVEEVALPRASTDPAAVASL